MVVPSRLSSEHARASTAMTAAGDSRVSSAATSSALSMPVCPSTPPASTLTGRSPARKGSSFASSVFRCRVASTWAAAWGPRASGVISLLPSPTTSTCPGGRKRRSSCASSWAMSRYRSENRLRAPASRVMYLPFFLPMGAPCLSSSMRISVMEKALPRVLRVMPSRICSASTPSRARSVRIFIAAPFSGLCSCTEFNTKNCEIILKLPIAIFRPE